MVRLRKTQPVEDFGSACPRRITADVLQAGVQLGDQVAVVRAFRIEQRRFEPSEK
jgi:hypothetical protein